MRPSISIDATPPPLAEPPTPLLRADAHGVTARGAFPHGNAPRALPPPLRERILTNENSAGRGFLRGRRCSFSGGLRAAFAQSPRRATGLPRPATLATST